MLYSGRRGRGMDLAQTSRAGRQQAGLCADRRMAGSGSCWSSFSSSLSSSQEPYRATGTEPSLPCTAIKS